jgi:hypothetical protein
MLRGACRGGSSAAHSGEFGIVLCEPILKEVSAALHHSQVRKRIALSDEELDRYVQALRYMAEVIDPAGVVVQAPADKTTN